MTELSNLVRARLKTQPPTEHPDADVLTAFVERFLPEAERGRVLAHLAICGECRDVLALATPALETTPSIAGAPAPNRWLTWPALRWASLAACLVVVGAAVLLHQNKPQVAMRSDKDAVAPAAVPITPPMNNAEPQPAVPRKVESETARVTTQLQQAPANTAQGASPHAKLMARSQPADRIAKKDLDESKQPAMNVRRDEPVPAPATQAPAPAPVTAGIVGGVAAMSANAPAAARETVEVTSAAPELETESAKLEATPGRAKAAASAPSMLRPADSADLNDIRLAKQKAIPITAGGVRWTLSDQGQLQRSLDGGKTWEAVPVVQSVTFRALSAFASEIWVGGPNGVVFHSSDAGTHWTQVKPASEGVALTGDVTTLRFTDEQRGQLTTSTDETWITTDGGRNWRKN